MYILIDAVLLRLIIFHSPETFCVVPSKFKSFNFILNVVILGLLPFYFLFSIYHIYYLPIYLFHLHFFLVFSSIVIYSIYFTLWVIMFKTTLIFTYCC